MLVYVSGFRGYLSALFKIKDAFHGSLKYALFKIKDAFRGSLKYALFKIKDA